MDFQDYQNLAQRTANRELTTEQKMLNGAMGLCGESGEVIDLLKKHLAQGHPLDKERVLEEVGDVLWYCAELATALEANLEDVAIRNIYKLKARYPQGFDAERSIHREGEHHAGHQRRDPPEDGRAARQAERIGAAAGTSASGRLGVAAHRQEALDG